MLDITPLGAGSGGSCGFAQLRSLPSITVFDPRYGVKKRRKFVFGGRRKTLTMKGEPDS